MSDWPFGEDHRRDVMCGGIGITRDGKRIDPRDVFVDSVYENEREALYVLAIIVAEFESDPMSVQCFDLRVVERAKRVILAREAMERRGAVPPLLTEGKPHQRKES